MIAADEAFEYLLVRNYTTFYNSEFDSAYHYLAAALHLAQASGNTKRLKGIALTAKQFLTAFGREVDGMQTAHILPLLHSPFGSFLSKRRKTQEKHTGP